MEPSAQYRTEIESLVDIAQYRVINGSIIHMPVTNAETPPHDDILTLLDDFADAFTDTLHLDIQLLAKPIISLIWCNIQNHPIIWPIVYTTRKRPSSQISWNLISRLSKIRFSILLLNAWV